jgi:hypothetical protein
MIKNFIDNVINLFNVPFMPKQEYFFNPYYYHPIYGLPGKVDYPGVDIKTWFGSPIPNLDRLNGRLDQHIVGQEAYRDLWDQHKRLMWYDQDATPSQISPYAYRPIRGNIGYILGTGELSSRDVDFNIKTTNPDNTPFREATFYQDILRNN